MHDAISSPSVCVCTALRRAARALGRHYDRHMEAYGLTINQFALLRHIARGGDAVALTTLADQLAMDRTTLYRALRPAQAAGWVETMPGGRGKAHLAMLTTAGRSLLAAATPAWEALQSELFTRIGGDLASRLRQDSDTLVETLR